MKYKTLRKISTVCLALLIPLTILMFFATTVGKGGILNDLDAALLEIEDLERRNLLSSPPASTSRIALREIKLVHNSDGLKKYIKEVEDDESGIWTSCFLSTISVAVFLARRFFKKKAKEEDMHNANN